MATFNGSLVVREHKGRVFYEGKWRDSEGRQVKRRIGHAWLTRDGEGWRPRAGRVPDGAFDEKAALVALRELVDAREAELVAAATSHETFEEVALAWLHHAEHVQGVKASTLKSHRYQLGAPGTRPRKRGKRRSEGRILCEFGGQRVASITTAQVERWLERLDAEPISKRTVNTYRQVVCSVLEYALRRPDRHGLTVNVARATAKRREPDAGVLDFYEPEEVMALARAAASGAHRDPTRPAVSDYETAERRLADTQDAAQFVVVAFTGLRMGELLELRWRRVSFERSALTVAASWSAGVVSSPKSRTVPLATPAAAELARLADRPRLTGPDDLVFCGPFGEHLDPSALRRRLARSQAAAGLRPLRFHDLRHSFGSLVVREVDTATLKAWMGHAKLTTTERYLHAKPRHTDVARLDRAFAGQTVRAEVKEGEAPASFEPERPDT